MLQPVQEKADHVLCTPAFTAAPFISARVEQHGRRRMRGVLTPAATQPDHEDPTLTETRPEGQRLLGPTHGGPPGVVRLRDREETVEPGAGGGVGS